jgi:hypothetical protein
MLTVVLLWLLILGDVEFSKRLCRGTKGSVLRALKVLVFGKSRKGREGIDIYAIAVRVGVGL